MVLFFEWDDQQAWNSQSASCQEALIVDRESSIFPDICNCIKQPKTILAVFLLH